jgi:hypothetical protein
MAARFFVIRGHPDCIGRSEDFQRVRTTDEAYA